MSDEPETVNEWREYLRSPHPDARSVWLVSGPYDGGRFPYPLGATDPVIGIPVDDDESQIAVYRLEEGELSAQFLSIQPRSDYPDIDLIEKEPSEPE